MKPVQALGHLLAVLAALEAGRPLSGWQRHWFLHALRRRAADPGSHLDRLLGLRTGNGGRAGGTHSRLPARDAQLRELAETIDGKAEVRAQEIARRWRQGALPALPGPPLSADRIARILRAPVD